MKNNLLLTTALVAVSFAASNAWADSTPVEWDGNSFSGLSSTTAVKKVSEEPVTANDVTVENNSNTSDGVGGAVYVQVPNASGEGAGNLTLNGGVFSNNYSKYDGGAIGNYGNLVVNDTKFRDNKAQFQSKTGENGNKVSSDNNHPIGGGALSLGAQSHTYIQGAEFTNNESGTDGGAISTRHRKDGDLKDARLTVENSTFTGNTAITTDKKGHGGAIFNSFAHDYAGNDGVLLKNNIFETNVAYRGGAIYGEEASKTIVDGGSFDGNEAAQGGAIWTQRKADESTPGGQLTVQNGTRFEDNFATYGGGAIWSGGKTDIFGASFKENQVTGTKGDATNDTQDDNSEGGGAIFVGSASTVTIEDSTFDTNFSGTVGGAIATRGNSDGKESGLTVNHSQFLHNKANTSGGAINIGSPSEGTQNPVTITDSEFDDNSSANGGAIYSKGTIEINNSVFTNNRADQINNNGGVGGALLNSGSSAKMTITNTIFDGNTALQGGAIYGNGGTVSIKGGRFTNNEATGSYGGAIASSDDTTLNIEDVTFEDNYAALDGGAISLTKEATFKGNNVFKNNSVGENKKNDIALSAGTITLAEGASLSLDGGISGKDGTLTLEKGSTLTVKDKTKVESKVQSAGNGENAYASVHVVVTEKTMNDEDHELKLVGEDGIFTQTGSEVFSSFNKNNNMPSSYITSVEDMFDKEANNLYTFEKTKESSSSNVTYTVKERSTGDIANRLGVKQAEAATLLATSSSKTGSGNEAFDDIQDTLRSAAQYGNDSATLSRAADALTADAAPVVQTRETMLSNLIFDAANDALDDNASALVVGQASGDSLVDKAKVWIKGLFNYADRDDTDKARGFDMDTYGVAMGVDKEVGAGKVGLGYAYSQSDINGYTRDTDVDTHSVFLYGQYQPADWYVKGVAAYSWSDYEEKKSVLGHDAKAKYDVDTLALEGLYGYDFHLDSGYDITPEGGLRYLHASQDSYTNGLGVRVKDRDIDVLTAVAGVKVAKDFAVSDSVTVRPELRAALTYDLSTDDNNSHVVLANGQAIKVDGEELDRFGFELGAKVATDVTSQWEVAAGYEGRFREDYSDHTGILSAKYKF